MVTSVDVEECRECREYEGMCHRRSSDDSQVQLNDSVMCECPVSRTGDHCETVRGSSSSHSMLLHYVFSCHTAASRFSFFRGRGAHSLVSAQMAVWGRTPNRNLILSVFFETS